jgi:hypothetical protein
MFTKGRPKSIIPIDVRMAKTLSVVPELPTPSSREVTPVSPPDEAPDTPARPLSEITEIYSYSDGDYEDEGEGEEEEEEVEILGEAYLQEGEEGDLVFVEDQYSDRSSGCVSFCP